MKRIQTRITFISSSIFTSASLEWNNVWKWCGPTGVWCRSTRVWGCPESGRNRVSSARPAPVRTYAKVSICPRRARGNVRPFSSCWRRPSWLPPSPISQVSVSPSTHFSIEWRVQFYPIDPLWIANWWLAVSRTRWNSTIGQLKMNPAFGFPIEFLDQSWSETTSWFFFSRSGSKRNETLQMNPELLRNLSSFIDLFILPGAGAASVASQPGRHPRCNAIWNETTTTIESKNRANFWTWPSTGMAALEWIHFPSRFPLPWVLQLE